MNKTLRILALLSITTMVGSFSACSYIHYPEKSFSDDDLVDKAASAIGMQDSELSVVAGSVQKTQEEVSYRVQDTSGDLYRCYFPVLQGMIGYMSSGAGKANCTKIERGGVLQ